MIPPNAFGMKVIAVSNLPDGVALIPIDPDTGDALICNMSGELVERIPVDTVRRLWLNAVDRAIAEVMLHGHTAQDNAPSLSTKSEITGREPGRITRK